MLYKRKRILITGGAGYIGSILARKLMHLGHNVSIVDDLSAGKKSNIPKRAKLYTVGINSTDLDRIFKIETPDTIVHMASLKSVKESIINPEEFERINVSGSKNVINLALKNNIKNFLFTSTAGVYGDATNNIPQKESDIPRPSSPYAATKLEVEKYILLMNKNGLNGTIVRFSNVYGVGGSTEQHGVINLFIERISSGKSIDIHGDGKQTRDFVHIDDLISALLLLLEKTRTFDNNQTPIYNISTGIGISINDLVSLIEELSGEKIVRNYIRPSFNGQTNSVLSTLKSLKELGWMAKIPLEVGILRTLGILRT